ncbi:UxaA family hydrolase [Desulfotomaculum copahuensis]|uniref:D-galactarate dehydratase n=1 Tax=Desulfotomaculum copahuensis TaxID=1838280 RepID=A0A1B7LI19_9FIRM|nr:UxaA family hydrolase [Desulfotomaculum copahuensis]OAT85834.1 D-galactarate dehydratase [Desulfotomaculum copahuensis]
MAGLTFQGYRRENGKAAIRNHVTIIPVDGVSNAAAKNVSKIIHGAEALVHPFGELQFGRDLELFFQTMTGVGSNPNVAAAVVIGMEPDWTDKIAAGIAGTGKPVASFYIERAGDLAVIERAARKTKEFIHYASEIKPREINLAEIILGIKCSESDTTSGLGANPTVARVLERMLDWGATVMFGETSELTGAEHIIADRFKSLEEQEKFRQAYNEYTSFIENEHASLLGSQPSQGNIHGGLSTIEEKAFGNIQKLGNALIDGVLAPAEPPPDKGFWFMKTSSAAPEVLTLFAAAGATLQIVSTGQGNIVGCPVTPVIKLSANPLTVSTMSEHIDLNVSGLLTREITIEQAGDMLMDMVLRTAAGRLTSSEVLGHREFLPTKLFRSA